MQANTEKVLALGCAGGVGQVAVYELSRMYPQLNICIADRNLEAAQQLAAKLGSQVSVLQLDVTNEQALHQAMKGATLVINAVGPYYRFGLPLLQAAITNGCNYIDICDDTTPTLQMLELHAAAQMQGIKAIIGAGASPGISNLMAVKTIESLDTVDHLFTGWNFVQAAIEEIDKSQAGAALEHTLHETAGMIPLYHNGRFTQAKALQKVTVHYPQLGNFDAYTFGHPEPVTLPLYFPKVQNTANVSYMLPAMVSLLRKTGQAYQDARIDLPGALQQLQAGISQAIASIDEKEYAQAEVVPPLFVYATGTQGQPVSIATSLKAYPVSTLEGATMMAAVTGVPLAVAAGMLLEGYIADTGVMAPEAALPADVFFEKLLPYCTWPEPVASVSGLLVTSASVAMPAMHTKER